MTGILDSIANTRRRTFPESVEDFVALELARRLNDIDSYRRYRTVLNRFPIEMIVRVFHTVKDRGLEDTDSVEAFHDELVLKPA